jgi:hypothetical protein
LKDKISTKRTLKKRGAIKWVWQVFWKIWNICATSEFVAILARLARVILYITYT